MRKTESPNLERRLRLRGRIGERHRSYLISPGDHQVGSSEDNDLVLPVSGVSRRHARLTYDGEHLDLDDLKSRNGTFVGDRRLSGGRLHPGDEVSFGPVMLRLEEVDARDTELALVLTEAPTRVDSPLPADRSTEIRDAGAEAPQPESKLTFAPGYVSGVSPAIKRFHQSLRPLRNADLPVLIEGETGVGKELVARGLHLSSNRSEGPFVPVNCAAIPADLLESEMFGIGEGVATGVKKRVGKFRAAEGGTLFLDELGEMPLELQAKLLRALQEKEIQPVGSPTAVIVDVWIVAATNVDLEQRVEAGIFRRDLYFRVAGFALRVPPLRERPEDVPVLVAHFLRRAAQASGKTILGVSAKTVDILNAYPWPGNVRELEHEVTRLAHLTDNGQAVESSLLAERFLKKRPLGNPMAAKEGSLRFEDHVPETERRLILLALERASGSQRQAARLLGIARSTLVRKIQELGISD